MKKYQIEILNMDNTGNFYWEKKKVASSLARAKMIARGFCINHKKNYIDHLPNGIYFGSKDIMHYESRVIQLESEGENE